ncbi:MAG: flagellar hook-associated protein 3 [candidate division Zixibacteria bacterium]|nr:flagellar hook-associated protein 3 [candidate division Zixibacteria bacterium]
MRVTSKMIADQVINNLSKNISRFLDLQNQMSTGRRIMKPSDDPIGTIKDLSYRSRLSEIEQYRANISEGNNWLASVDVALGDTTEMISQAKEIAVSLANDTYDATARDSVANEVESLFQQVLQSGNLQQGSRYLFSGHMTRTKPFVASAKGVTYEGDQGLIKYEIETSTKISINIPGSDILTRPFRVLGEDGDLNAGIDGNTLLADLNSGRGVDLSPGSFTITDQNLSNSVTITIPPATTDINTLMTEINNQLVAGGIDNLTVQLGQEGNNLKLIAADNPEISLSTPLSNLNYGIGIGQEPNEIRIHTSDYSTDVTADLSAASTIGDVITEINNTLTSAGISNVTASLNPTSTGIDIEDTNGVPLGLQVSEISTESFTGAKLGILGNISPLLSGQDVNPQPEFSVEEIAPGDTTASDIGLLGNFNYNLVGSDLDPEITLLTPLALMDNGLGYELNEIMIAQGSNSINLNLGATGITTIGDLIDTFNNSGLSIQATINDSQKGIQIESTVVGQTLLIEDIGKSNTSYNLGIEGSPDVLGNFIFLIDALRNNDQKGVADVIGSLDSSLNHILNERASVGAKMVRMETTESRLMDYNLEVTKLLSETEGADITKLVADLATQENIYTAALNSAAKIIQPSLLDFIR